MFRIDSDNVSVRAVVALYIGRVFHSQLLDFEHTAHNQRNYPDDSRIFCALSRLFGC